MTSNDLIGHLLQALGPRAVPNLASPIGAQPDRTQLAIQAALPILVGALARNASHDDGAVALHRAIEQDHSALDLPDVLGSVMAGGGDGKGILRHVLGPRQSAAAEGISQASGLGRGQALQLLTMLAPLVLNFLAQRTRRGGMSPQGLGALLGQQHQQLASSGGLGGRLMNAVLDRDGDGDVDFSDVLGAAGRPRPSGESPMDSRFR
jgi:hypothetical protein